MKVKFIRKRDARIEKFKKQKIENAIIKAFKATKKRITKKKIGLIKEMTLNIQKNIKTKFISVEEVQDLVEKQLIKFNLPKIAKAFILYREKKNKERETKTFFGVKDDLKLGVNAINVLSKRYLLRDAKGKIIETPKQLFKRTAKAIARIDLNYNKRINWKKTEKKFFEMMIAKEFLPNSPTLMNANTKLNQLSACFTLPINDSLESIFDTLKYSALIQQSGGGVGYNFSRIRPKGDLVQSTKGIASGPVSFIKIFNSATEVIKQGGKRRGANIAILDYSHPDVIEFIRAKEIETELNNFNISVALDNKFMQAVKKNKKVSLINPRTKKKIGEVKAKSLFELISFSAWKTGDPGILFIDEINKFNPTPKLGRINATNPCSELPLLNFECCNLGSINLSKIVINNKINLSKLNYLVHEAVHFLDNVIDANNYPLKEIEKITKANRKIGLGVMGFAEMLFLLGIPYNSKKALLIANKLMKFIEKEAINASIKLAEKRNSFPNFNKSIWKKKRNYKMLRNATLTTVAPTGSISIIAGTSSGIEPLFALAFVRNVLNDTKLLEVNPIFKRVAIEKGFYSHKLMLEIAKTGSIQNIKGIPKKIKRVFVTALDIKPEWHVRMQAAFQKNIDNAVSKTVNLPEHATVDDVKKIFLLAHKLKCKSITVYRYGSKKKQVLYVGEKVVKELARRKETHVVAGEEFSGGCISRQCIF